MDHKNIKNTWLSANHNINWPFETQLNTKTAFVFTVFYPPSYDSARTLNGPQRAASLLFLCLSQWKTSGWQRNVQWRRWGTPRSGHHSNFERWFVNLNSADFETPNKVIIAGLFIFRICWGIQINRTRSVLRKGSNSWESFWPGSTINVCVDFAMLQVKSWR